MRNVRRFVVAVIWLFLSMRGEAGWVEQRDNKTIIHLKLFDLPDPSKTDPASRADVAVVREFVKRFPEIFSGKYELQDVEVDLHRYSGIKVEGVESALLAIAGGVSPDVMYVNFRQSDTYIQQGFLHPLDDYLATMTEEEKAFRIHPKIWPVIERKGPEGQKHVWAMPYGGALGRVVTFRKDLFDDAGVVYPNNDWTWDDFLNICRKITDPARGVYGTFFSRGKHESWYWTTFLWSAGGDALVFDEIHDQWSAVFDSPEAAVALDFYNQLCAEPWIDAGGRKRYGYVYRDARDGYDHWERGKIAMMFAYIDEKTFSSINPDLTGMVPVPIGPTGLRGAELNSRMMGLFAGIDDPIVRDAAWEYIKFYDSEDAMRIRTKIMVEGGLGRFMNPRYLEKFGYPEMVRLAPKGWKECFDIAMETGKPEPYGKNSNYAYNIMTEPLRKAEELSFQGKLPENREARLSVLQELLSDAVAKANREMLSVFTPRQLLARRLTAGAVLLGMIVAFAWGFRRIRAIFAVADSPTVSRARRYAWAYLLLLPAIFTILLWQYVPLFSGSLMAFQDYKLMGHSTWVGLDNFGHVLWSSDWWKSIWNSARYSVLVIALTFLPPVILAILLQEIPRGKIIFRVIFYLPAVMTGLVVILLWKSFYDPSENGLLNGILLKIPVFFFVLTGLLLFGVSIAFARRLRFHDHGFAALFFVVAGGSLFYTCVALAWPTLKTTEFNFLATLTEPMRWLDDSDTAMFSCVLPMVWAGVGPGSLIYLAALKSVSDEFYEAADIDGATFIDKILFVIFPLLKTLLVINFVGVFIASWNAEANILAMTGGAANTEVAGLHIFYRAFIYLKFGSATAMAWMLGFMLIGFTVHQLRILSRVEFRTVEK